MRIRPNRSTLFKGSLLAATFAFAAAAAPPGGAQETVSVSVAIYAGSCFDLKGDPLYKLEKAVRVKGSEVRALPAISESVVDVPMEQLQEEWHTIVVTRSGKLTGMLACGEINSVTQPDGSVAVGLREQLGSLYGGIATLTPDGGRTAIRTWVAGGLNEGLATEDIESDGSPVDDTVTVRVTDDGIEADQTTIRAGSRVEFVVTNDGTEPHEVMLELFGADEEPLPDGESHAETEDIAEGESATFAYTFDGAGFYQLADHIGDNDLALEIIVE